MEQLSVESTHVRPHRKPNSVLIAYLYTIQGIILSLPGTIILTYAQLPGYDVLSIFALASIPFSFKFISAPILETYTSNEYGRRKTWIVISCLMASVLMFIMSFYTTDQYMLQMAVAFIVIVFFISLEDISTDALGVKELNNPDKLGFLQASMQQAGSIFGSLIFIKMVSAEFGRSIGLQGAIMSVPSYFRIISMMILVPTIFIHLFYKQERLPQQQEGHDTRSLIDTFKEYKLFSQLKYSMSRQVVMFLLYMFGLNFFNSGYQIELVRAGFSKETLTLINNFMLVPTLITTYIFSHAKIQSKLDAVLQAILFSRTTLQVFGLITNPNSVQGVSLYMFLADVLAICAFMGDIRLINSYPVSALSGMYITMLNSSRNLGNNSTIQLKLIGALGFQTASWIGIGYSIIWVVIFRRMRRWISSGERIGKIGEKVQ